MSLTPQKYCTLTAHPSSLWCLRPTAGPAKPPDTRPTAGCSIQAKAFGTRCSHWTYPELRLLLPSSSLKASAPSLKTCPDSWMIALLQGCSSLHVPGWWPSSLWLWPSVNRHKPMGRMVIFGKAMMFALGEEKSHQARSEKYFSLCSTITVLGVIWQEPNI